MMFRFLTRRRWLKPSEVAIFFPTAGYYDGDLGHWHVPIHGWVAELTRRTPRRAAALSLFKRYLKPGRDPVVRARFLERARFFVASKDRVRPFDILVGDETHPLDPTGRFGHVLGGLSLSESQLEALVGPASNAPRWLRFRAVTREGDTRQFEGAAQIVPPEGISVVSDIDDTLKVSEVSDRRTLLQNTFLREFVPVRGMADLLGRWAELNAAFHYVSASPWQLYIPLANFFQAEGFPAGSFHLQPFRVRLLARRKKQALEQFTQMHHFKAQAIARLLEQYPRRKFVLLGDSGQHDPEIYGTLARKWPETILQIAIRDVTGESLQNSRMRAAFAGVPPERCHLFKHPAELDLPR